MICKKKEITELQRFKRLEIMPDRLNQPMS